MKVGKDAQSRFLPEVYCHPLTFKFFTFELESCAMYFDYIHSKSTCPCQLLSDPFFLPLYPSHSSCPLKKKDYPWDPICTALILLGAEPSIESWSTYQ